MASIAMKMFRPAAMRSFANASRMGANVPSVSVGAIRFMSDLKFASSKYSTGAFNVEIWIIAWLNIVLL